MSWDQVAEELEGLLATRCERALPTAEALAHACDRRGCDVVQHGSTLPAPTSQERSRLARVLQTSGSRLEALDAALEPPLRRLARGQQSPASNAALVQLHTALNVLTACSNVAGAIQCTPAEGADLARAGKLLVRSGTAALQAAAAGQLAAASVMLPVEQDGRMEFKLSLLSLQATGMSRLLGLTLEAGRLPSAAAADVVAWLEAIAALLAKYGQDGLLPQPALEQTDGRRQSSQSLMPNPVAYVCGAIVLLKASPEYGPAMQSAACTSSLADALLPWLPNVAAAVVEASQGSRAPLTSADWLALDHFGQAMMVARPAVDKQIVSGAAEGGSAPLQLLQQAAQLAAHWPHTLAAGVSPAVAENLALCCSFLLAGIAGSTHNGQIPWLQQHAAEPACTALRRKQAAALLPVLPSLRAALRTVLGQALPQKRAQQCASIVDSYCGILSLLKQASHPWMHTLNEQGQADPACQAAASLEEVPTWCAAASEALAALSLWPEVEAAFGGAPPAAQPALCQRLADLARIALATVNNAAWVATILVFTEVEAGGELEAELGAELQAALWRLHTALLRLQHFALPAGSSGGGGGGGGGSSSSAAAPAAGQVLPALMGDASLMLLELYTRVLKATCGAAEMCRSELECIPEAARLPPEEDDDEAEANSTLLALQAAHWEAVAAVLPACAAVTQRMPPGPGDVRLGCITDALVGCVRSELVLFTPAMRAVINQAFELRPEDPFKRFMLYGSLADASTLSPALAAALLADGLVEVLLADLTGEACVGDHRIPEPQCRSIAASLSRGWSVLCDEGGLVADELAGTAQQAANGSAAEQQQQPADAVLASDVRAALVQVEAARRAGPGRSHIVYALRWALPGMSSLAVSLDKVWARPQEQLFAAQAAAARSCAYLRCADLGADGRPAAGTGGRKCSRCRVAHYCGTACSHADWKTGGHKRMCALLAAAQPPPVQE